VGCLSNQSKIIVQLVARKWDDSQHIYKQIADLIKRDIQVNLYQDKNPGERNLGQKYSVNFKTINKAISLLINQGILYRINGKGTFVVRRSTFLKRQSITVGLILPTLTNPYYSKFAEALQWVARKKFMSVLVSVMTSAKMNSLLFEFIVKCLRPKHQWLNRIVSRSYGEGIEQDVRRTEGGST